MNLTKQDAAILTTAENLERIRLTVENVMNGMTKSYVFIMPSTILISIFYYFCLLIIERFLLFIFEYYVIFPETRDLKSDLLKIQHKQTEVEKDILRLKTNVTGTHC